MTRRPDPPRFVVTSSAQATAVLRELAGDGWTARDGFALPEPAGDAHAARLVLVGQVADLGDVQQVVLAAARGAGVIAVVDDAGELGRVLLDDLSRFGPVRRAADADVSADDPGARLVPEQRALLNRLANGETIAAAAAAEFLSLRTANRRIAQARELFGVRTTREAVVVYLRQRRGD